MDLDCLEDVVIEAVTGAANVTADALVVAAATVVFPSSVIPKRLLTALPISSRRFCLGTWGCGDAGFRIVVLIMTKGWAATMYEKTWRAANMVVNNFILACRKASRRLGLELNEWRAVHSTAWWKMSVCGC